jgi:hypothetical protein
MALILTAFCPRITSTATSDPLFIRAAEPPYQAPHRRRHFFFHNFDGAGQTNALRHLQSLLMVYRDIFREARTRGVAVLSSFCRRATTSAPKQRTAVTDGLSVDIDNVTSVC